MSVSYIDPNDGLDDLEDEISVDDLTGDDDSGEAPDTSSVRDTSARLRAEAHQDDEGDDSDAGNEDDDTDEGEGDEPEPKLQDDDQGQDDDGEADDDDKKKSEAKTMDLTIPPIAKAGPRSEVELTLEGIPQEFHDSLKGHIGRSELLDGVQRELDAAQPALRVMNLAQDEPLATMFMLDQQDQGLTEPLGIGEQFAQRWLRANPDKAIELVGKFTDADASVLKERAELERDRQDSAVAKAERKQAEMVPIRAFMTSANQAVASLGKQLKLDRIDTRAFNTMAAARLAEEYREAGRSGEEYTRAEMLTALQKVATRFTSPAAQRGKGKRKDTVSNAEKRRKVKHRTSVIGGRGSDDRGGRQGSDKEKKRSARPAGVKAASARLRQER